MMLMLREQKGYIKSVDIAKGLGVTKPSVSYAVKRLKENGYIIMNEDSSIELTASGLKIAEEMYERHNALTALLMEIGVSEETACEDACNIEHDISKESFDAIIKYAKKNLSLKHQHHIKI